MKPNLTLNATSPDPWADPEALMTKEQVARLLHTTERSVERTVAMDTSFPRPIKIGTGKRQVRFKRREVLAWVEAQRDAG